jgi:DNA-binding NarL/FixJ family response regulator
LEHLPEDSAALRARVQASLARAYRKAAEPDLAAEAFKNSISLARECGDPGVLLDCLRKGAWTVGRNPAGVQLGLQISYETLELARCHGPPEAVIDALTDIVFQLCDMGEIAESQRVLKKLKADALQARQVHILNVVSGFETATAILQGRWSEALSGAREALSQVSLQGVYGLEGRFAFQMFAIRKAQGTLEEVADTATHIMESSNDSQFWAPGQILLHCELNQFRQARTALEQLGDLGKLPRDDLYGAALVFLAESCSKLRDIPRCKQLFTLLAPYRGLNVTLAGNLMFGAASGYLAMLAAIIEIKSEARALFGEAILLNKSMRAEPALARTQADYARMLLSSNNEADHAHAGRLIAEAIHAAKRLLLKPVLNSIEEMVSAAGFDSLTRREIEVLELIAAGSSNVKIAESLHISHSTVATHVRNIFRKTGASNRTEAAENARRAQLLLHD